LRAFLGLGLLVVTGCSLSRGPVPLARIQRGPAAPATRIVALPGQCRGEPDVCLPGHARGVDGAVRMLLEFNGYTVIDAEALNVQAARRLERTTEGDRPTAVVGGEAREVEVEAARFDDADPATRRALLADLEAEGVLTTSVIVNPRHDYGDRTFEVVLRLERADDGAVIWRSRCTAESEHAVSYEQAIERATRCAIEGAMRVVTR
jgi:hypothetical protein